MIRTLFWLLDELLSLYIWAVILAAVFSMLASFSVLDTRNRIVWTIGDFLYRVTEPALRPIRNKADYRRVDGRTCPTFRVADNPLRPRTTLPKSPFRRR